MEISNVWEKTNHPVRWTQRYRLCDNGLNKKPNLGESKSTTIYVIGIRLVDMFVPAMIEVKTLAPDGYDYRVFGPCRDGRVRRQDRHKITILCSPQEATAPQERQVQRHNYNVFVNTMASIFEKYGADILI